MTSAPSHKPDQTGNVLPMQTQHSQTSPVLSASDEHRALIALELEVLARKLDRFGWDRDRGTAAHDRIILDWIDALDRYPLEEIQAACRALILANPRRMPNEGDVVQQIKDTRIGKKPPERTPEIGETRTYPNGRKVMWLGAVDQWVEIRG